jgi:hypothetical protein
MAQATDMNSATPMPDRSRVGMQVEGLAIAGLYALSFVWIHLGSQTEFLSIRVLVAFFAGLILVPIVTGLPIMFVRRAMMGVLRSQQNVAAFATFANVALYALQGLLVWVVTREAYHWAMANLSGL